MKKIELIDQLLTKPMPQSNDISYKQGFLTCLNTIDMKGREPYESIKITVLSTRLFEEGPDWILEENEFDLIKKGVEQNNVGFYALIQGQLLQKLKDAIEIKLHDKAILK